MSGVIPFAPSPSAVPTMSSREIAELCGKRHDNVRRTIGALAESGVIVRPQIEVEPDTDAMGRARFTKVFRLDKRSCLIVVAQLTPEFTARVVDRWQELEATVATAINLDDPATLRALLDRQAALRIEEQAQLAETSAALARLTDADGALTITATAKMLGIGRKALVDWMLAHRWLYRHTVGGPLHGYAGRERAGLLSHVAFEQTLSDGSEKVRLQVVVTPQGAAELAKRVPDERRRGRAVS